MFNGLLTGDSGGVPSGDDFPEVGLPSSCRSFSGVPVAGFLAASPICCCTLLRICSKSGVSVAFSVLGPVCNSENGLGMLKENLDWDVLGASQLSSVSNETLRVGTCELDGAVGLYGSGIFSVVLGCIFAFLFSVSSMSLIFCRFSL